MASEADPRSFTKLPPFYLPQLAQSIPMAKNPSDLPGIAATLTTVKQLKKEEFGFSPLFCPKLVDACCQIGYFPMSLLIGGAFVFAIKVHKERMVMDLKAFDGQGLSHKRAAKYTIRFDAPGDWDAAAEAIVARHGDNWLCPQLRPVFAYIHRHPDQFQTSFHCITVQDAATGETVAFELGYCVGSIYTSLTGCYTKDGCGTVQLATLGLALRAQGYTTWDFGMGMDYKSAMGGVNISRKQWLARVAAEKELKPAGGTLGALAADGAVSCARFLPPKHGAREECAEPAPASVGGAVDATAQRDKKKARKAEKLAKALEWMAKHKSEQAVAGADATP